MEIIARKKKSVIALYAVLAVLGLGGIVAGIFLYKEIPYEEFSSDVYVNTILIIIVSAIDVIAFSFLCFRIIFSLGVITYDGEKIDFGKGIIEKPSRILNVEYHNSYFTQRTDVWGSLTVTVEYKVIKYPCIGRVGEVCNRLSELKEICRKSENEMSNSSKNES